MDAAPECFPLHGRSHHGAARLCHIPDREKEDWVNAPQALRQSFVESQQPSYGGREEPESPKGMIDCSMIWQLSKAMNWGRVSLSLHLKSCI
jgi:hypothetical protein